MSAFPPTRSIPSIPLPPDTALKYLTSYLASLPNNPHLLPNARLTSAGPTDGTSSSITIHNLQRVEAGLRGEFLKPELELEEEAVGVAEGMDDGTNKEGTDGEGWQDLGEYQREQSIEGGEIQEDARVGNGAEGDEDEDEDAEAPEAKKVKTTHKKAAALAPKPVDKEARKREKKAREKELKRQKALAAMKAAEES
ncbi:hypothetical protein B0J14DRAFT_482493 [Halenospora varia]|nr:hypothetical protein B0J14DRAFT_482493 [Halenospora varia]